MARSRLLVVLATLLLWAMTPAPAGAGPREAALTVVGLRAEVPGDARTAGSLGRERRGSGVVIDRSGLVLTVGYLIVEASGIELRDSRGRTSQAEVVAYDAESGLGLVRSLTPLEVEPVVFGSAATLKPGEQLLVLSRVGELDGLPVLLADRRDFAGYWEYVLDQALFTAPAHAQFGGAALIDKEGRLVGIGSLQVGDAAGAGIQSPGNMFVPIDLLPPILDRLLAQGRRDGPATPWIGLSAAATPVGVIVTRVTEDGPAARAGLRHGDLLLAVGGRPVLTLRDLWLAIRAQGAAGVAVPLDIRRQTGPERLTVTSIDRGRWLRWRSSL